METDFSIEAYLRKQSDSGTDTSRNLDDMERFQDICHIVKEVFDQEWKETDDVAKNRKLEREKKAMMGYPAESSYYKEKIRGILGEKKLLDHWFPPW